MQLPCDLTRLEIVAPGSPGTERAEAELVVARGAFGSGEHETTCSCLRVLETLDLAGVESVLDLGSGTGILALAALRLGAQRAVCVDPEAAAVRTSQRNAQLNGVEDRVVHVQGTLAAVAPWPFDLVLANLYGEVLLAEAAGLVARLGSTSRLLLSGILWQDQFAVEQSYCRLGCAIERTWMLEAYCTLLLRRGSPL